MKYIRIDVSRTRIILSHTSPTITIQTNISLEATIHVDHPTAHEVSIPNITFVRSGPVDLNHGFLRYANLYGYDWPATNANIIWGSVGLGAYYLHFDVSSLNPSAGPTSRFDAFPVRCLASGT